MAEIKVPLRPIMLPNYVAHEVKGTHRRGEGPKSHINELPRETVEVLCDDFKRRMLERWEKANG